MTRYALVIGISQYSYLSQLPTPTNDAETIAQILEKYGNFQQVRRYPYRCHIENNNHPGMVNQAVTGISVMQQLKEFLSEQAKDSEALIYFTGHGIEVKPYLGRPEGFLAASDCQVERDGSRIIGQKNGIPFSKLNEEICNCDLSNLVVILDCCHSGYLIKRELLESSFTFSAKQDYYLLAGCREFEQGKIIKGESHSVFTGALIQALSEQNADSKRWITGDRLFDAISRELHGSVQEAIRFGWGKSIQLLTYPPKENDVENLETPLNLENPYLGLKSFELEQAALFHGRETAVRALLDRLKSSRFVAVIGASGCGKSSLVKAGLLPELRNNYFAGSGNWQIEIFTPGYNPLDKLNEILDHHPGNQPYILFIDQFEEVFTLTQDEEERKRVIKLIFEEVKNQEKQTRVIIAIRGDFLDKCAEYADAANLINQDQVTSYLVQPLSLKELENAIEKPAQLHGVSFESGLVSKIIHDVAQQPGALPLMQYALKELWDVCLKDESHEHPQLTFAAYQKIGEVKGALEKRANRFYNSLTSEDDKTFIRRLFVMELVHLGEGKEVTRKRATWERLRDIAVSESQLNNLINRLVAARLIVTTEKTIEVAHEALFSEWSLLKDWIAESRDDIRLTQSIESSCREWQEIYHKSDDALLTGARLAAIEEWKKRSLQKLPAQEEEYISKSIEKRDKEQKETIARIERELEQERQLKKFAEIQLKVAQYQKKITIITSGLLIFAASLGLFSYRINQQKEQEVLFSVVSLLNQAKSDKHDQLGALLKSITTLDKLNKISFKDIENNKIRDNIKTIVYGVKERNRLEGHQGTIWDVKVSQDGQTIVSAGADKTIKVWSMKGELLATSPVQSDEISSINFNHNDEKTIIVSTSYDGYVKLWEIDAKNRKINQINEFYQQILEQQTPAMVFDASFHSNDKIIAFASSDGIIRLWDREKTGSQSKIGEIRALDFTEYQSAYHIYRLDFHPKSDILAYGYEDGGVYIWNWKDNQQPQLLVDKHRNLITGIQFSSDGKLLASASNDGNIKIWDTSSTNNYILKGEINTGDSIYGLALTKNKDGVNFLASSHRDKDEGIKIWSLSQLENNQPLKEPDEQLLGHTEEIKGINFVPNNPSIIVSSSQDETIRIWLWEKNKINQHNPKLKDLLKYACYFSKDYFVSHPNNQDVQTTYSICQNNL